MSTKISILSTINTLVRTVNEMTCIANVTIAVKSAT